MVVPGICSALWSSNDTFEGNQASVAGAIIYSTDLRSTSVKCQNGSQPINNTHCPEWSQGNPNQLGPNMLYQYGPGIAYPALSMTVDPAGGPNQTLKYISDGASPLPMPLIHVVDQAGQIISSQGLMANLSVINIDALPPGANNATLPNQIQATADNMGAINFDKVVLLGAPIKYNLTVAVPEVCHCCNSFAIRKYAGCTMVYHTASAAIQFAVCT